MMKLGFYMATTCFATQIASKNLLNKRTLFAKLKKNTYLNIVCVIESNWLTVESPGRKPD